MTVIVNCPVCHSPVEPEIEPDDDPLEVGESLECDQCQAMLVVISVDPLEIDVDEDDDEEDSDEDSEDDGDNEEEEDAEDFEEEEDDEE